ncbi:hypothetical protein RIVM261_004980 [Rivularia sp. IAM M-261]|nr:hypothetical protein CAL7716_061650 [Calothrix sp. PCC 7716]GJD15542.1 hypothetical protein RIVM261_004980 [Rivularia sp. IAM M-261]
MTSQNKVYTKPKLSVHGNVEALTQGGSTGNFLDRDFPDGTPRGDLTFSETPMRG